MQLVKHAEKNFLLCMNTSFLSVRKILDPSPKIVKRPQKPIIWRERSERKSKQTRDLKQGRPKMKSGARHSFLTETFGWQYRLRYFQTLGKKTSSRFSRRFAHVSCNFVQHLLGILGVLFVRPTRNSKSRKNRKRKTDFQTRKIGKQRRKSGRQTKRWKVEWVCWFLGN